MKEDNVEHKISGLKINFSELTCFGLGQIGHEFIWKYKLMRLNKTLFLSVRTTFCLMVWISVSFLMAHGTLRALEIYPGPGVDTYKSSLYTVGVKNETEWVSSYTYGISRQSRMWFYYLDQYPSVNFTTFGTVESVQVQVTKTADSIVSASISPKSQNIVHSIIGGKLEFTMRPLDKLWVVINGDEANPLFVCADAPKPDIPSGAVYFGPGVHDIGQLFVPADNSCVYIDGGAWVKGNIDLRGRSNVKIQGRGVLSGEKWQGEFVNQLPWTQQKNFFMIAGNMDDPADPFIHNSLEGITIVMSPMYNTFGSLNNISNVKLFSPWYWSTDAFYAAASPSVTAVVQNCLAFVGDDIFFPRENFRGNMRFTNCLVGTTGNNVFQMEYWGYPLNHNFGSKSKNIDIKTFNQVGIFTAVVDTDSRELGFQNQIYEDIRIEGNLNCPLIRLEHRPYPYGVASVQMGNSSGIVFRNVTLEGTQAGTSKILGKDAENRHQNILFENLKINGIQINQGNHADHFQINEFNANIHFAEDGTIPDINSNGFPDAWETTEYWRLLKQVENPWHMDSDQDGDSDAFELAGASSPLNPNLRYFSKPQIEDGGYIFRYRQRSGGTGVPGITYQYQGFQYIVEASPDMKGGTWQSGAGITEPHGPSIQNGDGSEEVAVRIIDPAKNKFLRLRVARVKS